MTSSSPKKKKVGRVERAAKRAGYLLSKGVKANMSKISPEAQAEARNWRAGVYDNEATPAGMPVKVK